MTSVSLITLLVNGIPESFLDVLAIFILTKTPFDKKKYLIISLCFIIINYLIKLLPIGYGVNTMLGLLILVLLFVFFLKPNVPNLIKSTIIILITLFVSEQINLFLLLLFFGKDKTLLLLGDPISNALCGIPSKIVFAIVIYIIYVLIKKKNETKK